MRCGGRGVCGDNGDFCDLHSARRLLVNRCGFGGEKIAVGPFSVAALCGNACEKRRSWQKQTTPFSLFADVFENNSFSLTHSLTCSESVPCCWRSSSMCWLEATQPRCDTIPPLMFPSGSFLNRFFFPLKLVKQKRNGMQVICSVSQWLMLWCYSWCGCGLVTQKNENILTKRSCSFSSYYYCYLFYLFYFIFIFGWPICSPENVSTALAPLPALFLTTCQSLSVLTELGNAAVDRSWLKQVGQVNHLWKQHRGSYGLFQFRLIQDLFFAWDLKGRRLLFVSFRINTF